MGGKKRKGATLGIRTLKKAQRHWNYNGNDPISKVCISLFLLLSYFILSIVFQYPPLSNLPLEPQHLLHQSHVVDNGISK